MLAVGCIALVLGYRSISALASANGIAVTLTMLATTGLFYVAAQRLWKWSPLKSGAFCVVFGAIELMFFAANALKIMHGGWFPLVAGGAIFTAMTSWQKGRKLLRASLPPAMPLHDFIGSITLAGTLSEQNKLHRVPGTAVFLASDGQATPNAMLKNIKHNQILHARNVILTVQTDRAHPHVDDAGRLKIEDLGEGFYRLTARFGFMEIPDIGEIARAAEEKDMELQKEKATFFIGKERIVASPARGMAIWREHLFILMSKNAENAADFFRLPADRVYEVSQVVEI
jgi:KUP system potassium uptake protein